MPSPAKIPTDLNVENQVVAPDVQQAQSSNTKARTKSVKSIKASEFGGPKKSRSAYFVFADEMRNQVISQLREKASIPENNYKFNVADVSREISDKWKLVSVEDKDQKYGKVAKEEKVKHDEEAKKWKESEEFKQFEKAKVDNSKKKKIEKAKEELKSNNQPKRPTNGYMQFTGSIQPDINQKINNMSEEEKKTQGSYAKLKAKLVKEAYEALSQEQKDIWTKKYKDEKKIYDEEMIEFKKSDVYKKFEKDCDKAKGVKKTSMKRGSTSTGVKKEVMKRVKKETTATGTVTGMSSGAASSSSNVVQNVVVKEEEEVEEEEVVESQESEEAEVEEEEMESEVKEEEDLH